MTGEPWPLIVLFHGIAARGIDLAALHLGLFARCRGVRIEAPNAAEPCDSDPRYFQWYSHARLTPEDRPARVEAARPGFDRILHAQIKAARLSGRPDRVALVGFSQGANMVMDAVASGRWPVGAAVGLCGRFTTRDLSARPRMPVLLIQGGDDGVIGPGEAEVARTCFSRQGADFTCETLPGCGHEVTAEGIDRTARFLGAALGLQLPR